MRIDEEIYKNRDRENINGRERERGRKKETSGRRPNLFRKQ